LILPRFHRLMAAWRDAASARIWLANVEIGIEDDFGCAAVR
jgi:hypothetical protein